MEKYTLTSAKILSFLLIVIIFFLLIFNICFELTSLERVILPFLSYIFIYGFVFVFLNILFKDKFVSKIYLISILLHLIFILFWNIFKYHILGYSEPTANTFVPFTIDNDGVLFHRYGVYIAQNFSINILSVKLAGGWFPKIIGIIYHYFGISPFLVCLFNISFSALVAPILYLIGKNVFKNIKKSKFYSLISILTFSHIMNTSCMMRDGYITLFVYLSIFFSYFFYKKKNITYLLLTFLSLFCLYSFRPYAAFVIFFAIIVSFLIQKLSFNIKSYVLKTNIFSFIILILSPIIVTVILYLLYIVFNYMNILSVDDLIEVRELSYQYGDAQISFDFGALYSKFFLLPFIVGYIYLFGAPFPWEWGKPSRIVYVPDMLILYCFLPSFCKNLKSVFTDKNYFLIVFFFSILFMFCIYCITLGNSGAIHRLRGVFIPMIYLIAMYRPNKFLAKILYKIQKWRIL